jgi:hypothetical protein
VFCGLSAFCIKSFPFFSFDYAPCTTSGDFSTIKLNDFAVFEAFFLKNNSLLPSQTGFSPVDMQFFPCQIAFACV